MGALLTALLISLAACMPTADKMSTGAVDNIESTDDIKDNKVRVDKRMKTDITLSNSFTTNSYDDIKIGDTFDAHRLTQNTNNLDGCFGAQRANHPNVDYMIIDNKVVEISTSAPSIASAYGVKVGDSLDQLYAKYQGQQPEVEDSPYGNLNENLIIYYWYKEDGHNLGIKYQVDNEVVTSISIGLESAFRLWACCA